MKRRVNELLDIHTQQGESESNSKSIINYQLLADSPLHKTLPEGIRMALGRGVSIERMMGFVIEGESVYDDLSNNMSEPCEGYYYSAGLHPWELTKGNAERQLAFLEEQLVKKQFVAVGEAGIDKLAPISMEFQMEVFRRQIELSEKYELPLIIHCVKAMDELLALKSEYQPKQHWIWHGFRGNTEQAEQLIRKGIFLSFGENYPAETMKSVCIDHLFIETDDSPFSIEEFLIKAAKVRKVKVEVLREAIQRNIEKVFFKD